MNELEIELIEEYKRIDILIKDMFNSETGVSEYISRMDGNQRASYSVPGWNSDYRQLKHMRYVRNRIMHNEGDSLCTESDLDFAYDFHDRLLSMDDPLAKLCAARKKPDVYVDYREATQNDYSMRNQYQQRFSVFMKILFLVILFLIVFFSFKEIRFIKRILRRFVKMILGILPK
ncbi:MAG: hypothetical protein IJI44_06730 [Erysipelotrichaceae bacterium]|nr:hypothetical protein [Erysipelotrichaceae bacterium]